MPNTIKKILSRLFDPIIKQSVREQLAVAENENAFFIGTRRYNESDRDRLEYDRADILDQCLDAWRESPLARRIVELTSQYVVGPGFDIKCQDETPGVQAKQNDPTRSFINQFWNHRLNRMPSRVIEMCDELTRTGNLFLLIGFFLSCLPPGYRCPEPGRLLPLGGPALCYQPAGRCAVG